MHFTIRIDPCLGCGFEAKIVEIGTIVLFWPLVWLWVSDSTIVRNFFAMFLSQKSGDVGLHCIPSCIACTLSNNCRVQARDTHPTNP